MNLLRPALLASLFLVGGCAPETITNPPATLIREGWRQYEFGEYQQAARAFESARQATAETDPAHRQALYGLATTWNLRTPLAEQDQPLARSLYQRVIELAPNSDLAAWSLLGLARMEHLVPVGQEPDYDRVRAAYRAVVERFPDHLAGDEAFIYLQATYVATLNRQDAREAAAALAAFIRAKPDSGFVSAAHGLLAACHETLQQQEKRLAAAVRSFETAELDPTNPRQENSYAYWSIATIAEFEVGDFETAREFYRRLMDEYPRDPRRFGAEQALERMAQQEAGQ